MLLAKSGKFMKLYIKLPVVLRHKVILELYIKAYNYIWKNYKVIPELYMNAFYYIK